jgi:predicted peroxiredoxin
MKTLNIIEAAYRGTIEEQDDTIVWIAHAMKGAGADLALLLRGSAVSCAVRGQDASGLAFGAEKQSQPPRLADDLAALLPKGVTLYAIEEDIVERGIEADELIEGIKRVGRADLPRLFADFERVWHW